MVDYLIVSPDLFSFVSEFKVIDFDPLVSDVHNRLHVTFSTIITTDFNNKSNTIQKNVLLNRSVGLLIRKHLFVDNVENKTSLVHPLNHLDLLDINSESYQLDLNDFVVNLNSLYIKSAMDTFGEKIIRNNCRSSLNRPWFNKRCHEIRTAFHHAKKKI